MCVKYGADRPRACLRGSMLLRLSGITAGGELADARRDFGGALLRAIPRHLLIICDGPTSLSNTPQLCTCQKSRCRIKTQLLIFDRDKWQMHRHKALTRGGFFSCMHLRNCMQTFIRQPLHMALNELHCRRDTIFSFKQLGADACCLYLMFL